MDREALDANVCDALGIPLEVEAGLLTQNTASLNASPQVASVVMRIMGWG